MATSVLSGVNYFCSLWGKLTKSMLVGWLLWCCGIVGVGIVALECTIKTQCGRAVGLGGCATKHAGC